MSTAPQTFWCPWAYLHDGWAADVRLTCDSTGAITEIKTGNGPDETEDNPTSLPGYIIPGMPNLHSHAFQRAMAGLTEARGPDPRDSFWSWRRLMYRFLDQLTPDDVEAIAGLVFMEMLEAGYAAVGEFHYLHHAPGGVAYDNPAETSSRIAAAAIRHWKAKSATCRSGTRHST